MLKRQPDCDDTAAALACLVLKGEMASRGVWDAHVMDHRSGHLVAVRHRPRLILSWLLQSFGPAVSPSLWFGISTGRLHHEVLRVSFMFRVMQLPVVPVMREKLGSPCLRWLPWTL